MDSFYKFASENPWLTFFLFLIVGNTIYYSVEAIMKNLRPREEKKSKKA